MKVSTKPRILLVEDEEPIRTGLTDVFLFNGYEVDAAADGPTGLEKALAGGHHLVILDVMLPGMDGFSICNQIREVDRRATCLLASE